MPTYVYRREDGSTFEVVQRISEEPLTVDPATGQRVQRVISGAGLIFKGDGFYLTDYVRKNGNGSQEEKTAKKAENKAETKESASGQSGAATETKPQKPAAD